MLPNGANVTISIVQTPLRGGHKISPSSVCFRYSLTKSSRAESIVVHSTKWLFAIAALLVPALLTAFSSTAICLGAAIGGSDGTPAQKRSRCR
jgi:hypothetical protein